jgi:hypothetical protein
VAGAGAGDGDAAAATDGAGTGDVWQILATRVCPSEHLIKHLPSTSSSPVAHVIIAGLSGFKNVKYNITANTTTLKNTATPIFSLLEDWFFLLRWVSSS